MLCGSLCAAWLSNATPLSYCPLSMAASPSRCSRSAAQPATRARIRISPAMRRHEFLTERLL
jgi:hypothetical protein